MKIRRLNKLSSAVIVALCAWAMLSPNAFASEGEVVTESVQEAPVKEKKKANKKARKNRKAKKPEAATATTPSEEKAPTDTMDKKSGASDEAMPTMDESGAAGGM